MGAATFLLYAGMLEDGADFYIADCPFSDFKELVSYLIKKEIKLSPNWSCPFPIFSYGYVIAIPFRTFHQFLSLIKLINPFYLSIRKRMISFYLQ